MFLESASILLSTHILGIGTFYVKTRFTTIEPVYIPGLSMKIYLSRTHLTVESSLHGITCFLFGQIENEQVLTKHFRQFHQLVCETFLRVTRKACVTGDGRNCCIGTRIDNDIFCNAFYRNATTLPWSLLFQTLPRWNETNNLNYDDLTERQMWLIPPRFLHNKQWIL